MVDCQFFAARTTRTVLARKVVSLKNVSATKRYDIVWQSIISSQGNDFRNAKLHPLSLNGRFVFFDVNQRPVFPSVLLEVGGVDNAC